MQGLSCDSQLSSGELRANNLPMRVLLVSHAYVVGANHGNHPVPEDRAPRLVYQGIRYLWKYSPINLQSAVMRICRNCGLSYLIKVNACKN